MAYKKTTKFLREATNISSVNMFYSFVSDRAFKFYPQLKLNDDSDIGNWVRDMDVISGTGIKEIHPGYIAVAAYGQGAGVYRLNDDGTLTEMMYDLYPHGPTRNYQYMHGVGYSDDGLHIFITNYVYRHMAHYEFTDNTYTSYTKTVYNGGTSYDGGATTFPNADFGRGHRNGMMVCGDWIYFFFDSSSEGYANAVRWNWRTKTKETLDWNYGRDNHSSANRYGDFSYHKESDTLLGHGWYRTYYVFDASTDSPKTHVVQNYTGAGYWQGSGFFSKNKTWRAYGRGGIVIDDITNLRANKDDSGYDSTTAASYVLSHEYGMQDTQNGFAERGYSRMFQGESQLTYDPKGDIFYIMPDRGQPRSIGFWDKYNFMWVGTSALARYVQHPKQSLNTSNDYRYLYNAGNERFYDYGPAPIRIGSYNNGTKYWLAANYSYTNKIFAGDLVEVPYQRFESAEISFNNFEHGDGSNVEYVRLRMVKNGVKLMPNSSAKVYVRSDSNAWQEYEFNKYGEYLLKLETAGRYIDVKFELYGDGINIAYYTHYECPILEMESVVPDAKVNQAENLTTKRTLARAKQKRRFRNRIRKIGR